MDRELREVAVKDLAKTIEYWQIDGNQLATSKKEGDAM
jgi:hypothetical protein